MIGRRRGRGFGLGRRRHRLGLRGRLTLLLGLAVLLTVALAWILTGRMVLEPFARDLLRAHLEQVAFLAGEVERGADPRALGERLGLEVRRFDRPPRSLRRMLRSDRCHRHDLRGRALIACRGPRGAVAVELEEGWLVVRRSLDPEAPKRRVAFVLVSVATVVLILSAVIATFATRPLRTSVNAMERMASGDLTHRLPESGSPDLGEAARAFNRMADRVTALLEAERSLMAGISHELRTPLARLRLELELLRDHPVPEKRRAAMEADVSEIDQLIGEVLEASRLSIGDRKLSFTPVDLRAVVEEALGTEPLPGHDVRLVGEASPVWGDHPRLVRVVRNLLQNAGKYAPADTEVEVGLSGRSLTVSDRGPGVPPSELPRIFEPFYRGERGRKTGATGHGLGLMIARQVVELHGGRIEASNREGGGLTVRLELSEPDPDVDRPGASYR